MMPAPLAAPPAPPMGVPAALWAWLWLLVQLYIKLLLLIFCAGIHTCRGTVFGEFIGRAAIVIASALAASTTPKMPRRVGDAHRRGRGARTCAGSATSGHSHARAQVLANRRVHARARWRSTLTFERLASTAPSGQSGVVYARPLKGHSWCGRCDRARAPIVDTLTAYKLVQYSDSQNQHVTGDAIALTNVMLDGAGLGVHSYIDAATFTNSATHLVLSGAEPEPVRSCSDLPLLRLRPSRSQSDGRDARHGQGLRGGGRRCSASTVEAAVAAFKNKGRPRAAGPSSRSYSWRACACSTPASPPPTEARGARNPWSGFF